MIEWLITKYSNGKIIIINKNEEETPIEELTKDIVSIMNVYVAKVNGLRKYKTHIKEELKKDKKNNLLVYITNIIQNNTKLYKIIHYYIFLYEIIQFHIKKLFRYFNLGRH